MLKKKCGKMECPKNPGKYFTWWYYEDIGRNRNKPEVIEDLPEPQFIHEYNDENGIPVIRGVCPICHSIHKLDADSALDVAKEFNL